MGLFGKLLRSSATGSGSSGGSAENGGEFAGTGVKGKKGTIFRHSGLKSVILEFQIELQECHRVWKPDEIIEGTVKLRLKRDVSGLWIRLSHIGECYLRSNNPITTGYLKPRCSETLFCKRSDLYGSEQDPLSLTSGEHNFPFSCKIPSRNMVSSIDFKKGAIKYWVQAELMTDKSAVAYAQNGSGSGINLHVADSVTSASNSIVCKQRYQLIVPLDVSRLPKPNMKTVVLQSPSSSNGGSSGSHARKLIPTGSTDHQDTNSSLTRRTAESSTIVNASLGSNNSAGSADGTLPVADNNKTVKISVDIPCLGYTIGEVVPVKVHVSHYKHYSHPAGIIATIVRICRVSTPGNSEQIETFRKDISQSVAPLYTDPDTLDATVLLKLKVPLDTFPTMDLKNRFFSFQYYVEVLANLSRKNQVYTESNRLVGGQGTSDIPLKSNKLSFFPRLLTSEEFSPGEDDSTTFYEDLINVDRLKRLRNVTGMSIEVIIGTHREKNEEPRTPASPQTSITQPLSTAEEQNQTTLVADIADPACTNLTTSNINSPIVQAYDYLLHQNLMAPSTPLHSDNEFTLCYPTDPVPSYTQRRDEYAGLAAPGIVDDKQELEQMRLKELESEPPM